MKYEAYGTVLLTPSWEKDGDWSQYALNKAKGTLVVYASYSQARAANNIIRNGFPRERPNKQDFESFPSGHAATASAGRTLSSKNIATIQMNEELRSAVNIANTSIAVGALWARVEGKSHYPTDVLVGYSVGHFISGFIYDSLMNLSPDETFVFYPAGNKIMALYELKF